jgi:hypothetical protein
MHRNVARKFNSDGRNKPYRGHSVICQLPPDSPLASTLRSLRQELRQYREAESLFKHEALMPNDSWHTTLFIGIRDQQREPDVMPGEGCASDIKGRQGGLDGPYDEWLQWTVGQLRGKELADYMSPPYTMNLTSQIPRIEYSIGIKLEPTPETGDKIAHLREWLAVQTGLPKPTSTVFHITLAYLLIVPTETERQELMALVQGHIAEASTEVVFPVVDLCSFEHMQGFTRQYVFPGM